MQKTLKEIAELVGGEVIGDAGVIIKGVSGIKDAGEGDITFVANPKYIPLIEQTRASAIITSRQIQQASKPIVRTQDPSLAFAQVVSSFSAAQTHHPIGIHSTTIIEKNVSFGKNVAIGPYTVIEEGVCLGDDTVIYSNCFIGRESKIGSSTLIYPNVSVRERTFIGNRVIIHSGTVIGSDGFGYATIDGIHHKIPQVGTVEIGDDVEIGSNVSIDRARFDKTVIGKGSKIDNLVQIAHNVVIGENSIIVSQAGISGSTTIGKNVIIAGQAGMVGHIDIGDKAVIMAQAGVTKSVPEGTVVWGTPAKKESIAKRLNAYIQRLPKLVETVKELRKRVEQLELKLKNK